MHYLDSSSQQYQNIGPIIVEGKNEALDRLCDLSKVKLRECREAGFETQSFSNSNMQLF